MPVGDHGNPLDADREGGRASRHCFYRLDSGLAVTNLQLFALYKATETWLEIKDTHEDYASQTRGPCAFVVATMGLSLSQLLGQNPVKIPHEDDGVASPEEALRLVRGGARPRPEPP
jgi:hypothetical protein